MKILFEDCLVGYMGNIVAVKDKDNLILVNPQNISIICDAHHRPAMEPSPEQWVVCSLIGGEEIDFGFIKEEQASDFFEKVITLMINKDYGGKSK